MRVRAWQDIVRDVVESDVDPEGWRAVAGSRAGGLGEDLYLAHPRAGLFLLKTYAKNPFDVRGVGTRVARRVDGDIEPHLPTDEGARFAIRSAPGDESEAERRAKRLAETVRVHAEAPTTPTDLFEDLMTALESPAYGPMSWEPNDRPDALEGLASTFEDAETMLDADLDDLIERDGVERGFM